MSKKSVAIPADKLALYDKLVATNPDIERKGKTMPYTSLNGHMFSLLDPEGIMGLRLSEGDRATFLKEHSAEIMLQYGRQMKEYVAVPAELLADTEKMSAYLKKSYDYIKTLKPKPTTKKSKK